MMLAETDLTLTGIDGGKRPMEVLLANACKGRLTRRAAPLRRG